MVEGFLLECLDRSRRAALAKTRAGHENARLIYEVELAEYQRVLASAQAAIRHAWVGKRTRLEFLSQKAALRTVQRAWHRAYVRRALQREIGARVVVSWTRGGSRTVLARRCRIASELGCCMKASTSSYRAGVTTHRRTLQR